MLIKEKIILLLLALLSSGSPDVQKALTLDFQTPNSLSPGDPLVISLPLETEKVFIGEKPGKISIVEGRKILVYGIPLNFKEKTLSLTAVTPYGSNQKILAIIQRPEIKLTTPLFKPPTVKEKKQIEADKIIKQEIPKKISAKDLLSLNFLMPMETNEIISPFYEIRVEGPHYGVDFRAKDHRPIRSIGNGTIIFAKKLYLEGNMVVIDHGNQVISYYLHLSKFEDKLYEGKTVLTGEIIGYSGNTGKVTGEHLHLAMKINGEFVDPEKFVSEVNQIARQ